MANREETTPEGLRAFREDYGLTQAELADLLNIDTLTVSRWERGASAIWAPRIMALALRELRRTLKRKVVNP